MVKDRNIILFKKFNEQFPITPEQFKPFSDTLISKPLKRGEILLNEGEVDNKMNFVVSGIMHQYVLEKENQFTINIKTSGTFFNSLKSWIELSPSLETQEAITDVELLCFTKTDIEILLSKEHWVPFVYLRFLEQDFLDRENRSYLLQHLSAYERFSLFINTNRNAQLFLLKVPQKILASYLGMTPETFSKVKKEYFLQN